MTIMNRYFNLFLMAVLMRGKILIQNKEVAFFLEENSNCRMNLNDTFCVLGEVPELAA